MNLGTMRYLLHFYKPKRLANKYGEVKTCYIFAFSAWVSISELSSDESVENARQRAQIITLFKMRFAPLDTSYVALFNDNAKEPSKLKPAFLLSTDKLYEIISITDKTGLKKELEVKAKITEKRGLNE